MSKDYRWWVGVALALALAFAMGFEASAYWQHSFEVPIKMHWEVRDWDEGVEFRVYYDINPDTHQSSWSGEWYCYTSIGVFIDNNTDYLMVIDEVGLTTSLGSPSGLWLPNVNLPYYVNANSYGSIYLEPEQCPTYDCVEDRTLYIKYHFPNWEQHMIYLPLIMKREGWFSEKGK